MASLLQEFLALDLVVLRSQTSSLLFSADRFVLMRLSDEGLGIAETALSSAATDRWVEGSQVAGFLSTVVDYVSTTPRLHIFDSTLSGSTGAKNILPKLVLMVNNLCNLQCRYCYEHETAFKFPAHSISRSAVRTTLDQCYGFFESIETIMFIGGEPTLSEEAIEEACEYSIAEALRLRRRKPCFGMITNGVCISEHLHAVIERYGIQLTFSVDGPKVTHDLVRIRKDGSGSYDAVSANLKRYARAHPGMVSIESTVTSPESEGGLSISQLLACIANEFGVAAPHINLACLPGGHALMSTDAAAAALDKEYLDTVELSVRHILEDTTSGDASGSGPRLSQVAEMTQALGKKSATSAMCSAGTSQLVIDSHGDVYPCWMFAGEAEFNMGNILEDSLERILRSTVLKNVAANTKVANLHCSKCYARFLCHACIGNNRIRTGSIEETDPRFCDGTRQSVITLLTAIASKPVNR